MILFIQEIFSLITQALLVFQRMGNVETEKDTAFMQTEEYWTDSMLADVIS